MSECTHEFGEQFETPYKDIYGKKCKKCGFFKFEKGKKISDCGCRFENEETSSIILCEECSKLPCHGDREKKRMDS